uniref:Uncharacterized protein n=1 Tax=Solanum lycopersicum TaxID=4081 RepID=A0A3Q7HCN0_SOLLC
MKMSLSLCKTFTENGKDDDGENKIAESHEGGSFGANEEIHWFGCTVRIQVTSKSTHRNGEFGISYLVIYKVEDYLYHKSSSDNM